MSQISPVEGEMSTSRFEKIDSIYQEALKLGPEARAAYLSAACGEDAELRLEVEALLSGPGAFTATAGVATSSTVTVVNVGTQLGPYRIEAPIGAGGMGQVFRGIDTRLGRNVAIKISQKNFDDRFEREARSISALNHPHICTLYDVGASPTGVAYLVMELVEGETLAAKLKRGQLSLEETVRYGAQIADALAAAHAKGIIHRDLKPANVMITKSGVKVLDFGLAKSAQDVVLTASNVAMGTPAYMAPEQFEGKEADARTDIYALGLVLYEMASGKRVQQGVAPLLSEYPEKLAHIIERCLALAPAERWQSASDIQLELKWAARQNSLPAAPSGRGMSVWSGWAAAAIVTMSAAAFWFRTPNAQSSTQAAPVRFNLADARGQFRIVGIPKPSPDGAVLVYPAVDSEGRRMLWLRALDSEEAMPLAGTEEPLRPFWSPDGRWIGFYSQGKLKKVSRDGATVQIIASLPEYFWAAWGKGEIVLTLGNRTPLYRLSEAGGTPQAITKLDAARTENSHREVQFLPDGRHFLFIARCGNREYNALYEGSLDSGETRRIGRMDSNVGYVPSADGHGEMLLFVREGRLFQQDFDRRNLAGELVPLMEVQYDPIGLSADFALSANGRVLSIRPKFATATRLTWTDRTGKSIGTLGTPGIFIEPRISRDARFVIFNRPDDNGGNRDIWLIDAARNISSRLTVNPANEFGQAWAPDGKSILFASDRDGNLYGRMFQKNSMDPGSGEEEVPGLPEFANPQPSSLDGRWILFVSGKTHEGIWVMRTGGGSQPFTFLDTPFDEREPLFSPDSKWITYHSNESGRFEVYVRPFSGEKAGPSGKIQISEHGGYWGTWSYDGKEISSWGQIQNCT